MHDDRLDELAAWVRFSELLASDPSGLGVMLERAHRHDLVPVESAEQVIGAMSRGDIVHFCFGLADDEGVVEDGTDIGWCAVQYDPEGGYSWRVDIPEGGLDRGGVELLAAIAIARPYSSRSADTGWVMLAYDAEEVRTLAKHLVTLASHVEVIEAGHVIDGVIWERSEQPDDFPPLRDLPHATSFYPD